MIELSSEVLTVAKEARFVVEVTKSHDDKYWSVWADIEGRAQKIMSVATASALMLDLKNAIRNAKAAN